MEVRAAGGVVQREDGRIALVHRPRYDDWSLPKGKLDEGEAAEAAAVREVLEETGLRCALLDELPTTRYVDQRGRPKVVRWWRMAVLEDEGPPVDDEVDELRWCTREEAAALLTYAHDRALLEA